MYGKMPKCSYRMQLQEQLTVIVMGNAQKVTQMTHELSLVAPDRSEWALGQNWS